MLHTACASWFAVAVVHMVRNSVSSGECKLVSALAALGGGLEGLLRPLLAPSALIFDPCGPWQDSLASVSKEASLCVHCVGLRLGVGATRRQMRKESP